MSIKVVLPLPGKKLTAQANGNRFSRADAIKSAREEAGYVAKDVINRLDDEFETMDKATIEYRFFVPDNKQRDEANLVQMCKAYVDGCVDTKLIAGDHWQVLHIAGVSVAIDKKNPRLELIFSRAH